MDKECGILNNVDFYYQAEYLTGSTECDPQVKVFGDSVIHVNPPENDECKLSADKIYFEISGITFGNEDTQQVGDGCEACFVTPQTTWPVNIFMLPLGTYNEFLNEDISRITYEGGCLFSISDVLEDEVFDLVITDAANCDQKVRIEGLQQKVEWDPSTNALSHYTNWEIEAYTDQNGENLADVTSGVTYCDNYTGYTLVPKVQYRPTFDYGLKYGSSVMVITDESLVNSTTTWDQVKSLISDGLIVRTNVENVQIGDLLLSAFYLDCPYATQDFRDAPMSGFSFSYEYNVLRVTNKDTLGSTKVDIINDRFIVLPNTKLRVLTKDNGRNEFVEKYPEDLYPRP